ncbi:MAG: PQQ-binding-like beta-propeller repeat protein [Acidobacteriota bacterium]
MNKTITSLALCCSLLSLAIAVPGSAAPGTKSDWPQWSGPDHNLTSLGNGLFDRESFGLETVWKRPLGSAYSGISIVGDRVVTGFSDGEADFLISLDAATGEEQWRYRISDTYKGHDGSDDGPLASPMIADGKVYGLGAWGHLFALELANGKELWTHQVVEKFGARKPEYGFTTTPTVVGKLLVVETGGDEGRSISAFDRASGELRWSTGDDMVGYQSPIAISVGGEEQILAVTNDHMMGLDPATGKVLWQRAEGDGHDGFSQPVPVGENGVLLTHWPEAALFKISRAGGEYQVEEAWRSPALRGNYAIPIPYEGHLYGFSGRFLTCVDAATGETVWKSRPPGGGNLVLVDGHLVIQAPSGELVVAEATPEGYNEKARVQALDRGYYTRPSFAGGRFFVRNLTDIAAVGVIDQAPAAEAATESAQAQPELRGAIAKLAKQVAAADDKPAVIDAFMAKHSEVPILDGDNVHFVYRGEVADLALVSNLFQDGRGDQPMHRLEGTNFYYYTVPLPKAAHFTYQFTIFDERINDPLNPSTIGPEGREQSQLVTSGWQASADLAEPKGPRGTIEKMPWNSELLGREREVQVYLPPGYADSDARYPVVVYSHGDQALLYGAIDHTLDNLVGSEITPVIVALVPRADWSEFSGSATGDYVAALAKELIPALDGKYRTLTQAKARAVMGVGSAGFASVYAAFDRPKVFGKVAAQSFYRGEMHDELVAMIDAAKSSDTQVVLHFSSHDYKDPNRDFDARRDNKELVAQLEGKGFEPSVIDVDDGAGWGMWRNRTGAILAQLFPAR